MENCAIVVADWNGWSDWICNIPKAGGYKLHVHQCHAQKTFEIFDALLTVIVSPDLDLYTTRPEIHLAFT